MDAATRRRIAELAAARIAVDIADRRGLKWEWEKVDADVREKQIVKAWADIIERAFDPTAPPVNGMYRLHWKEGGSSLASVGTLHDGSRWYAPINWTSATPGGVVSADWTKVARWEYLLPELF